MSATYRTAIPLPIKRVEATRIARSVVLPPNEVARRAVIHNLFGEDYIPGTFYLTERKDSPAFLRDDQEEDYENWVRAATRSHIGAMVQARLMYSSMDAGFLTAIEDATLTVLDAPLESGQALCESITNQQGTDIIWRILKTLLKGNPYATCHVFREFNELGHKCAIEILKQGNPTDPVLALRRSVVTGALGVDAKAEYTAAGPSPLLSNAIIKLPTNQHKSSLDIVRGEIDLRTVKAFGIDCCNGLRRDVLTKPGPTSLLFFTDDYIETVFDLWAIQTWLRAKHNLQVAIIPKWGQHANDASFDDIVTLLKEPLFDGLRTLMDTRFYLASHGPAGSGINAYELSPQILEAMAWADVVLFKGARSYEMMQGIRKTTYFAFSVLHSYTETLTGLDATNCPAVILRQDAGIPSFDDFRARARRKYTLKSGRVIGLARMTALEYIEAIRSQYYNQLVREGKSRDAVNAVIMGRARASGKTFAHVILEQDNSLPDLAR